MISPSPSLSLSSSLLVNDVRSTVYPICLVFSFQLISYRIHVFLSRSVLTGRLTSLHSVFLHCTGIASSVNTYLAFVPLTHRPETTNPSRMHIWSMILVDDYSQSTQRNGLLLYKPLGASQSSSISPDSSRNSVNDLSNSTQSERSLPRQKTHPINLKNCLFSFSFPGAARYSYGGQHLKCSS